MSDVTSARLSEHRVQREARRVLPHLKGISRILAPHVGDEFGVFALSGKPRHPYVVTPVSFVRHWLRGELIELSANVKLNKQTGGSVFVLTELGKAFVARASAGDDKFAVQHRTLVPSKIQIADDPPPKLNAAKSPLAWLRLRKDVRGAPYISEAEFLAGERLRKDFTRALLTPRTTTSWPMERVDCSRRSGSSLALESDAAMAARARFWAALDAVGQELASILIGVCCHLEGLEALESRLGLPKRSGKTVLKLGLGALARHYGLARSEGRSRIRSFSMGELPAE